MNGRSIPIDERSVASVEAHLRQVGDIESVAIDHGDGEILAVHVLATGERKPKLVVRDVVSMVRTRLNVSIDHKKVSVVVPGGSPAGGPTDPAPEARPVVRPVPAGDDGPADDAGAPGPRVAVHAIAFRDTRGESEAEVVLRHSRREAMGIARGRGSGVDGARLVAAAAAHALERFLDSRHRIEIGEVKEVELGERSAVLVTVSVNRGRDEYLLLGSCWVFDDLKRATVYAVLDATNRVIGRLQRRQYVDYEIVADSEEPRAAEDRERDEPTP